MEQKLIRINGKNDDVYYLQVYPNETIGDVTNLFKKKYYLDVTFSDISKEEKDTKITDLLIKSSDQNIICLYIAQQSDIHLINSNDSTSKSPVVIDENMEKLIDKFKFSIGLTVSKEKIISVLSTEYSGALGPDPDNVERIKALAYLIQTESSRISNSKITDYPKEIQKALRKLIKKTKLPECVVFYVFFQNNKDEKKTLKCLKDFLEK